MVSAVTCQNCGEHVDAQYARVFGNEQNEVHACRNCSTQGAIANGAAVDADRDGTLLVHRPGVDEPVEATFHETESDEEGSDDECFSLSELRARSSSPSSPDSPTERYDDESFAALVAE
ncbi:hypothetical protein GOC83_19410 [Haloarcula rubripromontorii]|uniref:Small CPxCG-related zinc finger protein n=1 Tax=Haloarcula rubripromontorii TaxID=1705562 RepID=A0A847UB14_9EURY|nr:hypothetical protein [Haloarcula rubripromontorii]NLV08288.1 hypothetical protein [Haloarcula rubripromontorii]